MRDSHHILFDDGAGVQLVGDIVTGGSDDFHSPFEGCMVRACPDECRQEGMVDIDDTLWIRLDHAVRDDLHVACQYNEVDIIFLQQLQFRLFLFHLVFFGNGEHVKRNAEAFSHRLKVRMVADDERNIYMQLSRSIPCQNIKQTV